MRLYLATNDGFYTIDKQDGAWELVGEGLNGRYLTTLIAREGVILAGTQDSVLMSEDEGQTWQERSSGLTHRHVRWLAYHPDISDFELAGTEPAAIFISRDGGASWLERPEVGALRDQFGWWLPYSPEAGCVRGFAFHGDRAYAAVEVGGLLRSDDGGASWRLSEGATGVPRFARPASDFVHPDVHSVVVHPSSPDLVFAPTGGGFYRSRDGGATWDAPYADCYVRAVWVNPTDPQHMIVGPAEGASGRNGRIEETSDGGETWSMLTPCWSRKMVERFTAVNDTLFAVMSDGSLLERPLLPPESAEEWTAVLPDLPHINAVTAMG